VKEEDLIICRCEEVTEDQIKQAIADGARTIDGVKKRTRAGMGLCQGKTCRRVIARIIAEETGQKLGDLVPPTSRAPVRPIKIDVLAGDDE
jgi:NAD(P)H-nitrite reductase large subunit